MSSISKEQVLDLLRSVMEINLSYDGKSWSRGIEYDTAKLFESDIAKQVFKSEPAYNEMLREFHIRWGITPEEMIANVNNAMWKKETLNQIVFEDDVSRKKYMSELVRLGELDENEVEQQESKQNNIPPKNSSKKSQDTAGKINSNSNDVKIPLTLEDTSAFIAQHFRENTGSIDNVKSQLSEMFSKRHEKSLENATEPTERGVEGRLHNRNMQLVEKWYAFSKKEQIENSPSSILSEDEYGGQTFTFQANMDIAQFDCEMAESNLNAIREQIELLKLAIKTRTFDVFGEYQTEVDYEDMLKSYQRQFEEATADLEIAQVKQSDVYEYIKEQKAQIGKNEITRSIERNDLFEETRTGEVARIERDIKYKEHKYRNPTGKEIEEI